MFFGGREVQDAAKLGQVRPKMGQSWAKLGLSWHLKAILVPRWPKMAKMIFRMRLQIAKMRFWRGPGGVLEGSWAVNPSVQG